jgi:metal-responsive CopG/Arc/MetJ family transcriptional regulator
MSKRKLTELLQPKKEVEKKKVNLYMSADMWEEIERYAESYGYGKRKSEFVEKLLDYALDELRKLERRKKGEKTEEN